VSGVADPKPLKRIVNPSAKPLDPTPLYTGVCPLCGRLVNTDLSRHHVVSKGQGGDDVPENLVWACGDGTRGCHGVLTHRGRGDHGDDFAFVGRSLLCYLDHLPDVCAYVERTKYVGWLERYYGAAPGLEAA
jgi:hypothetical protein